MKTLYRSLTICALILLSAFSLQAQPQNRANSTIIVDALNQLPANDAALFNRLMEDIVSTGQEGIDMLITTLEKKDASMVAAEYALDGLSAYASADSFDAAKRQVIVDSFLKAAERTKEDGVLCAFYERQLRRLGAIVAEPVVIPEISKEPAPAVDRKNLVKGLKSSDYEKLAKSAWTLVKIKDSETPALLASFFKSSDEQKVALAEECLKCTSGSVADAVSAVYDKASTAGKVAAIHLLAQRMSIAHSDIVFKELDSKTPAIREASLAALKDVVCKNDVERLYTLLEQRSSEEKGYICDAILAAFDGTPAQECFSIFSAKRAAAQSQVQDDYIPLLIRTADIPNLFDLCGSVKSSPATFDAAYTACIKLIKATAAPQAQKLLLYRKAFAQAQTAQQKNAALDAIGMTGEFEALIFAGSLIEDPDLQQNAARAAMKVALAHPEFNGTAVRTILTRVTEVLSGQDSEYEITSVKKHLDEMPSVEGFVSMFNGKDLTGWKGLVENPIKRAVMTPSELEEAQKAADERMAENWKVEDGCIVYEGKGFDNLCSAKDYGDFEMYVDWMLDPSGKEPDAGIYLRGTPQVQIWDTSRVNVGAQVGSGGLYNNKQNLSKPLCVADNKLGEWNSFRIKMIGERVTVWLNGVKVVDNVILENYWDRSLPIPMCDQIELQAHGSRVCFRDLYIKEYEQTKPTELSASEKKEGFTLLFDGTSLNNFEGNTVDYYTDEGTIHVSPTGQGFGNLYAKGEYDDFVFRFEFKLTPGCNNGVGIRCEEGKDAAYYGMEIQILDHFDPIYVPWLKDYQYHGSVYGIIPAQRTDALKPVGEWNCEEIYAKGNHIKVTLNGIVITEGDIGKATKNGTYDGNEHPGLFNKSGRIGFLGHGSELWIRNVRVKKLK